MTPIIPVNPAGLSYGPEYDRVFAALCAEVETSNTVVAELRALRSWLISNMTWCAPEDAPLLGLYGQRIWYHVTNDVAAYPFTTVIDNDMRNQ